MIDELKSMFVMMMMMMIGRCDKVLLALSQVDPSRLEATESVGEWHMDMQDCGLWHLDHQATTDTDHDMHRHSSLHESRSSGEEQVQREG